MQATFAVDGGRQRQRHQHQRDRRPIHELAKFSARSFRFRHENSLELPREFHQWSQHQEPGLVSFIAMLELHGSRRDTFRRQGAGVREPGAGKAGVTQPCATLPPPQGGLPVGLACMCWARRQGSFRARIKLAVCFPYPFLSRAGIHWPQQPVARAFRLPAVLLSTSAGALSREGPALYSSTPVERQTN